ncbi:S49 family peptidase [bacterium]|nr:MAG: S49 family peptidase [bacterium]
MSFFTRHPYYKNLLKFAGFIFVGYHTLMLCLLAPLFFLIILAIGLAASTPPAPSQGGALSSLTPVYGDGLNQLLSIKVEGIIAGETEADTFFGSLGGLSSGYAIKDQLIAAADSPDIKGVILEINSPGGTIYGSHAIADGVEYYRTQTKKPVYAFISGMGDSGAYWAAASTDKILADYGSDTGSIGVIMGPFEYYNKVIATDGGLLGGGVITQNGVEQTYITAGRSKDIGNPYRRLTGDEVALLQRQVNNEYENFVAYVASRRQLTADTIKNQIGALSYDNKTAKDLKLIDATANRDDAYSLLAEAAQVGADYTVVRSDSSTGFITSLLGAIKHGRWPQAAAQPSQSDISARTCALTKTMLAYHGDVAELCPTQ